MMADDAQYELDFGDDYIIGDESKGNGQEMSDEEVAERLTDIVESLAHKLRMQDWVINVIYAPDEENPRAAQVSFNVHKEADLTVFSYRPHLVYEDMLHELMHCKVSSMSIGYAAIIENQSRTIAELMQNTEEVVIDDLMRMTKPYVVPEEEE